MPQWRYLGTRQAVWPQTDFVAGNPPFIGNKRMREALGDGYALALRAAWPDMPESADLVMFWWARAAALVAAGQVERMGLITTNSLTMIFNRRVVQSTLESGVSLLFAIPDHPWVDSADGAAVRIAMTVVARNGDVGAAQWGSDPDSGQLPDRSSGSSTKSGSDPHFAGRNDMTARLLTVTAEQPGPEGEVLVTLAERRGVIHADLSVGADVSSAQKLEGNSRLSVNGMMRAGEGFLVSREQAIELGLLTAPGLNRHIVDFRNGRDLTDRPRGIMVIDAFGLSADELRSRYPAVYQWLYERVKPERDHNNRQKLREQWWTFAEPRKTLRAALVGIDRYIATVETSKHRVFQFLPTSVLPEHKLIAIALDDAFHLGVLSSQVHVTWALATGGHLGVGNDPVYSKSTCFDTFPFPDEDTGLTPALRHTIGTLAEQIDTHRKRVLGLLPAEPPGEPHPPESAAVAKPNKDLTLTGLYNVLQALREGRPLNPKEKTIHSTGLVGVLKTLHDELDAAVLAAYGWPDLAPAQPTPVANANTDAKDALLQRLVTLNQRRALEEAQGRVRWLRPAFQNLLSKQELPAHVQRGLEVDLALNPVTAEATPQAWPGTLPEQVKVVAHVLASSTGALTLAQITACFTASASLKNSLPTLLQTLEALGRAQQVQVGGTTVWRA